LSDKTVGVKEVWLAEQQVYRISFTAPLINQARAIAFLVFGTDKAVAVAQVLGSERNIEQYPAQLIAPSNGTVDWYLDEAAASELEQKGV
jgi:6-phosphogluconolactonase